MVVADIRKGIRVRDNLGQRTGTVVNDQPETALGRTLLFGIKWDHTPAGRTDLLWPSQFQPLEGSENE